MVISNKTKQVVTQKQFYRLAEAVAQRREDLTTKCHTIEDVTKYIQEHVDFTVGPNSVRNALEVHNIKLDKPLRKNSSTRNSSVSNSRRTIVAQLVKILEALGMEPTGSFAELCMFDLGKFPNTYKVTSVASVTPSQNISVLK